jgi:hypothetical protein
MSTPHLDEWDSISAEWRAPAAGAPAGISLDALRAVVRRRSRARWLTLAAEVVLTVVVVTWALAQLPDAGTAATVGRAAIVGFTAAIWGVSTWNRRHSWRALGATTADFLRLAHAQLDAGERSLRWSGRVVAAVVLVWTPWVLWRATRGAITPDEAPVWALFALYLVAMLGGCAWYARWLSRERAALPARDD